jgi:hypothetical protein
MKKILTIFVLALAFAYCKKSDNPLDSVDSTITAREQVAEVVAKAREDFAPDSKLAIIYGRNVQKSGDIDLLTPTESQFIYGVQSDSKSGNEFYIPVFGAGPVKSPLNFTDLLNTIKDTTAKGIIGKVFQQLSKVSIEDNTAWIDSPQLINVGLNNGGNTFITSNNDTQIDMLLVPGVSIDLTYIDYKAIWIINFHNSSKSLVLLIDAVSGKFITKILQ